MSTYPTWLNCSVDDSFLPEMVTYISSIIANHIDLGCVEIENISLVSVHWETRSLSRSRKSHLDITSEILLQHYRNGIAENLTVWNIGELILHIPTMTPKTHAKLIRMALITECPVQVVCIAWKRRFGYNKPQPVDVRAVRVASVKYWRIDSAHGFS